MKVAGRYIAAIDYYHQALLIENEFAMASLNLSFTLFRYAHFQIKDYEQNYFHHACYHYYLQAKQHKINLESQDYLIQLEESISHFHPEYIEGYLKRPLNLPVFNVDNQPEADYRNYLLICRLFLEPCLDILGEQCFAVDSINLPLEKGTHSDEFIGLFNQIKQEYNLSRYLWYKTTVLLEPTECHADREIDYVTIKPQADHTIRESLLRTAFKTAYSTFDRIGYFINEYFEIGLSGSNVSFKNIWKEELKDRTGKVYFEIPNPIMKSQQNNHLILAIYWLQKDFYEDKKTNVTSPNAEPMFQMRNDMEHNCLRTSSVMANAKFTKFTSENKIEYNTYKLLKLLRETIIYLCLAVNYDIEEKRTNKAGAQ